MARDIAGSSRCSRGIRCWAPASACPVFSRTYDRCTVVIPVRHLPSAAQVVPLDPGGGRALLDLTGLIQRPDHQAAAPARPARRLLQARHANRRTSPIAAKVSQEARLSSRWVRSGVLSPACSAIVHPLRLGSPLTRALMYFPACSHGSGRAKHDRSRPSSSARFRPASPDPILAAAAAFALVVVTHA
jgi:hypothetical protein